MRLREGINTFRGHRVPHLNIIAHRNWWFALSGFFIALSLVGLFARGLNFSIEFKGGAILSFPNTSGASIGDYQAVLDRFNVGEAKIEVVNGSEIQIRTKSLSQGNLTTSTGPAAPSASPAPAASPSAAAAPTASATGSPLATSSPTVAPSPTPAPNLVGDQIRVALARAAGISADAINEQDVGPTWGSTISKKAIQALLLFLVLVTLYISLRFEWKMAIGALVALAHDLIITAGIYALVGRQVTPESVIAILTILGYSLYDTVVIFDKVKENTDQAAMVARETYSGMVNVSLNQTLMRSVNTSLVVLLPIGTLLLFGGATLKDFAFALFVGVASGTYSSIFVASPILAVLKEREPRFQQIRAKAASRAARPGIRAAQVPGSAAGRRAPGDRELAPATLRPVPGGRSEGNGSPGATAPGSAGARSAQRPSAVRSSSGTAASGSKKKGKPKPKRRRR